MPTPQATTPATGTEPVIEARGLSMRFGRVQAVHRVDLSVARGAIHALLGPNGAGKTTTIELLEGYRRPTNGRVRVLGADPARGGRALRERIGILLQEGGSEPDLRVGEVLDSTRRTYPHPRPADELLDLVGLGSQRRTRVRRLSAGQRRRLELALALAGDPDVVFLDEPTLGFDPVARREAWQAVRDAVSRGASVLLTTNAIDEAEALADRVTVIAGGRLVAEGTVHELVGRRVTASVVRFRLPVGGPALPAVLTRSMVRANGPDIELRSEEPARLIHELGAWAVERGVPLHDLTVAPRSLEDAYLELVAGASGAEVDRSVVGSRAKGDVTARGDRAADGPPG